MIFLSEITRSGMFVQLKTFFKVRRIEKSAIHSDIRNTVVSFGEQFFRFFNSEFSKVNGRRKTRVFGERAYKRRFRNIKFFANIIYI